MAKHGWWKKGVKFRCQGSGNCCLSRGEYGFVYLTKKDRKKFAEYFNLSMTEFTKKYCDKSDGTFHLKENKEQTECMFLVDNKCSVYEARPTQCRTWPFWPENMHPKSWNKHVTEFCPGVGKGQIVSQEKIEKDLTEQAQADEELGL